MIRLTSAQTGNPIFVNPEKINFITRSKMFGGEKNETLLKSENGEMFVTEFPEEVARKVLEWRLAMEGYRIFTERASIDGDYDVANSRYDELKRLVGLEEKGRDE